MGTLSYRTGRPLETANQPSGDARAMPTDLSSVVTQCHQDKVDVEVKNVLHR
jgi:hypothetical protein